MIRSRPLLVVTVPLALWLHASASALAHPLDANPTPSARLFDEINQMRAALRAAVSSKDAARLRDFYTEDFTHTHTSGKVDGRDARIVSLLAAEPTVEMAPTPEFRLSCFGESVCIIRAVSPIKRMSDGKWFDVRWTQTLVRTAKGWQLAVSQATGLMNTIRDQP